MADWRICTLLSRSAIHRFFWPKGVWLSELIHGGIVLLTYIFTMPFGGRLWYREGESEDWRIGGLFIVIGLNIALPVFRGLTFKKPAAEQ